jgi:hypothetical protein
VYVETVLDGKMDLLKASYIFSLLLTAASALPKNHTDSRVSAAIDNGTFANPSANVRPRFRYWVPDASVDHAVLKSDVAEAMKVGAGGVELLGYYLYGHTPQGTGNFAPDDWSVYGWGTEKWNQAFQAVAETHRDEGGIMSTICSARCSKFRIAY